MSIFGLREALIKEIFSEKINARNLLKFRFVLATTYVLVTYALSLGIDTVNEAEP